MKKIILGIGSLILATLAFAFMGTQKTIQPPTVSDGWFIYNGGNPVSPGSYTLVENEPDCPGDEALCAIRATINTATNQPTSASLADLQALSSNFTVEVPGQVEFEQ